MDRLRAYEALVNIDRMGSFTKAARKMRISPAMIGKYVNYLEAESGVKLVHRNTRNITFTDAGKTFLKGSKEILAANDSLILDMESYSQVLDGAIKVSAPVSFGHSVLVEAICGFQEIYPEVRVELELSNELSDLIADKFDLIFRSGELKDSSLISRCVARQKLLFCASPEYFRKRGEPASVEELKAHNCLGFTPWFERSSLGAAYDLESVFSGGRRFTSNSGQALVNAALLDAGIILQPEYLLAPYLLSGRLLSCLEEEAPLPRDIHLIYPVRDKLPKTTRAFIDYVVERLTSQY